MKVDAATIPAAEVRATCKLILASGLFSNAPRLSSLLNFLIEKAISRDVMGTSEYAIGIEVFGRDPSHYNTGEDPIVRVQAGRLRRRLETYYETRGADTDIEIMIPLGRYMPVIRRVNVPGNDLHQKTILAIWPLRCLSQHEDGDSFVQGLYDELLHHIHKTFGEVAAIDLSSTLGNASALHYRKTSYRLEGCVQIDAEHIRVSMRLIAFLTERIVWSGQLNRNLLFTIAVQEELAMSICNSLAKFLVCEGT